MPRRRPQCDLEKYHVDHLPRSDALDLNRIPFIHGTTALPLKRCVEQAALRSGRNFWEILNIITYFFEEVGEQIAEGEVVNIPGFGAFAAVPYICPSGEMKGCQLSRVFWRASSPLKSHVRLRCPPTPQNIKRMRAYQKTAATNVTRKPSTPQKTYRKFRAILRSWAEAQGMDLPNDDPE